MADGISNILLLASKGNWFHLWWLWTLGRGLQDHQAFPTAFWRQSKMSWMTLNLPLPLFFTRRLDYVQQLCFFYTLSVFFYHNTITEDNWKVHFQCVVSNCHIILHVNFSIPRSAIKYSDYHLKYLQFC